LATDEYFGKDSEKWKWSSFKSTNGFPVSKELMDWIIGQDKAMEECKLCIDEWVAKLLWLKKQKWWKKFEDPMGLKPQPKEWLPAGPFLLMLGDAGTGKSLLGRAMSSYMTDVYKKHGLKLYDVLCWRNPILPSEPKISIHPAGEGKELVIAKNKRQVKKSFLQRWGTRILMGILGGFGAILLGFGIYNVIRMMQIYGLFEAILSNAIIISIGGSLMFFTFFIWQFSRMFSGEGNGGGQFGIGGAQRSNAPKLIIDNSSGRVPFIDATGHGSAQLFGSIAWDPYQTGGLGTPEHQRVSAGDVHRAHLGILFIDEIKNLTGPEAITLLTVLEDGQLPIALRSLFHGGDTAAMAVATEPIPCMNFLIAAGNLDSLPNIHAALLDRIQGYGKVVYMNNDMPNSIDNRRKFVQFISQEVHRFHLLPFSHDACMEIIDEARRRSGKKDYLTCKFRPMISIIKTASTIAHNERVDIVDVKHVREALNEHCKSIGLQVMEKYIERDELYSIIDPTAKPKVGQIHGLAVMSINREDMDMVGSVLLVRASCKEKAKKKEGYFNVTGVEVKDESYVQHSIAKVRHTILQLLEKDIGQEYCTHIDFAQEHGVEGPSAGVTMTLALYSCLTGKKIRQDVAVTGEINIQNDGKILVTPIGGVHEKIMAAQKWGFKKVLIPKRNYDKNINPKDYKIEVVGCETLEDYIREIIEEA